MIEVEVEGHRRRMVMAHDSFFSNISVEELDVVKPDWRGVQKRAKLHPIPEHRVPIYWNVEGLLVAIVDVEVRVPHKVHGDIRSAVVEFGVVEGWGWKRQVRGEDPCPDPLVMGHDLMVLMGHF